MTSTPFLSEKYAARFWAKVDKTDTCWLWTDSLCIRGHEFTEENTRIMVEGGRRCRACVRIYSQQQRDRRRLKENWNDV